MLGNPERAEPFARVFSLELRGRADVGACEGPLDRTGGLAADEIDHRLELPVKIESARDVDARASLGLGPADRFPLLTSRLREPGLMQRTGIGPKPSKLH